MPSSTSSRLFRKAVLDIPHYKALAAVAVQDNIANAENRLTSGATTVGRQRLRAVNFMPWPEYMTKHGLGTDAMKASRESTQFNWRLMFGSKPIPENFCFGTPEALSYLKMALGIESARDGVSCGSLTYDFSNFVGACSTERAVGGLRGQGISTRNGGAPVIFAATRGELRHWSAQRQRQPGGGTRRSGCLQV